MILQSAHHCGLPIPCGHSSKSLIIKSYTKQLCVSIRSSIRRAPTPHGCGRLVDMKKLGTVVCLFLFASACAGSESEELAQTRAELDALKGQVAGSAGLMGTHQTPTTVASPSGLRSPDIETLKGLNGAERQEWIRTDLLIGLPWRDAGEVAHDAGWATKMIFAVEGEPVIMTRDFSLGRLRLVVFGGEEAGTVADVINS